MPHSYQRRTVPQLPPIESLSFPANIIRQCTGCELHKTCTAPVPGDGAYPACVLFLGQNPGQEEDLSGKPFVGRSGEQLDSLLFQCSIPRESVYITNVIKCVTLGNRAPKQSEIDACSYWFDLELELVSPRIIVAMGAPAIRRVLGADAGTVEHLHGRPVEKDGRIILPSYHPAAALRDTSLLRFLYDDFQVLRGLVNGAEVDDYTIKDEYPNPDYRVVDGRQKVGEMMVAVALNESVAIDVETVNQGSELWSVQASVRPGTGFFVPMKQGYRGTVDVKSWNAHVIVHNYLYDAGWLIIPDNNFSDTMTMAYLLGLPQGLKELAARICGIKMISYNEVVRPGQRKLSIDYLTEAARREWPDPPDVEETKWDNSKGKVVTRIKHPWHISRKMSKILVDAVSNTDVDPYERWMQIDQQERACVEKALGVMPESSLADVPLEDAVQYACLSGESKVLMANGRYRNIDELVRSRSDDFVMSWDYGVGIVARRIAGWYKVCHKDRVPWLSVSLADSRAVNGRWKNHGTRYTPDHRIRTRRGWVAVKDLVVGEDEVALPIAQLTETQYQVVLGSILGDGNISQRNCNGWSNLRLSHSAKQEEYLRWKVWLLGDLCRQEPKQVKEYLRRTPDNPVKRVATRIDAETIHHPMLNRLRMESYLPYKNIGTWADHIDALALAIFYMDDGTLVNGKYPRLYACDFDMGSVDYFREIILRKWGIRSSKTVMSERDDQYQIHILAPYDNFWSVVASSIHPSMGNKLPLRWRGLFREVADQQQERYPVYSKVVRVDPNPVSVGRRGSVRTSWCIDVEHTGNFVTMGEIAHNCRDADATLRVKLKMDKLIREAGLDFVLHMDTAILPMVRSMMQNGMAVDLEHLRNLSVEYDARMRAKTVELSSIVGHPFNPNSRPQVATVVYQELGFKPTAYTPSREVSTDDQELKKVKHPVTQGIIEYRRLSKMKGTYADALVEWAIPDDKGVHRVHTTLKTTRTETGRLASVAPNLQNIPTRNKEAKLIKSGFVAPVGRKLAEGDLAQIEMCTQAHLARCKGLIDLFLRGDDPHTLTASRIFGVPYEDAKQEKYRYPTKRANFGVIYMIGARGLSEQITEYIADLEMEGSPVDVEPWSVDDCQKFIDDWYKLYPEVRDYQQEMAAMARRHGYVSDLFGRRRFIPEVASPIRYVQETGLRMAANMPVTASAQGILKLAMGRLWRELPEQWQERARWLMQIHDSLIVELDDEDRFMREFLVWMRGVMCNTVKLLVPVKVDFKVGAKWGELEKYNSEVA